MIVQFCHVFWSKTHLHLHIAWVFSMLLWQRLIRSFHIWTWVSQSSGLSWLWWDQGLYLHDFSEEAMSVSVFLSATFLYFWYTNTNRTSKSRYLVDVIRLYWKCGSRIPQITKVRKTLCQSRLGGMNRHMNGRSRRVEQQIGRVGSVDQSFTTGDRCRWLSGEKLQVSRSQDGCEPGSSPGQSGNIRQTSEKGKH